MTDYICTNCDFIGQRKVEKPGSRSVEIFLWVVFFIPGAFYSIWRILNKKYSCPHCGEPIMISSETALGQRRLKQMQDEIDRKTNSKMQKDWEKDIALYQIEQAKKKNVDILDFILKPIFKNKKNKVNKNKW